MSAWLIELQIPDDVCTKVVYGDSLVEALAWFIAHNPTYINDLVSIRNYDP